MARPTKPYGIGKRLQGSIVGEPGLLAGYTLGKTGGPVPSHDGAFTATLSGDVIARDSILGRGVALGRVTGAVDLGVGNAQINPTTDSHWVEVWARPLDYPMVDARVPLVGKGLILGYSSYTNFGILFTSTTTYLYWRNAAAGVVAVSTAIPQRNKLTHYLYQVDRTSNNAYLYIDGVQYGPTAITTVLAAEATNWKLGKCGTTDATFDEGFGGFACCPRIGTGVLTAAQVQARYLLGARAIQFKTDWGVKESVLAVEDTLTKTVGCNSSPFRIMAGGWRMTSEVIEGQLTKVMTTTAQEVLNRIALPLGVFEATPTERAFGTWDFWTYKTADDAIDVNIIASATTVSTGYSLQHAADDSLVLRELGVGNVVTGGTATTGAWHHHRITRDITGLFTCYTDGVAWGTGTDLTTTTATHLVIEMGNAAGNKIAYSDIQGGHAITKFLGVVP